MRTASAGLVLSASIPVLAVSTCEYRLVAGFPNQSRARREVPASADPVSVATHPKSTTFAIRLPFDLPVPDGTGFRLRSSVDPDQPPWVTLEIHRVRVAPVDALVRPYDSGLSVVLGESEPDLSAGASSQTWVMATTLNVLFEGEPDSYLAEIGGFESLLFERCLSAVNIVSDASRLVSGEINSWPITKDSLDPTVAWLQRDLATGQVVDRGDFTLHARVYNPLTVVEDPPEMQRKIRDAVGCRLAADASPVPHPLLVPRNLARWAIGLHHRGEAMLAVMTLQTAAEGLLRGLHRLLLVDAGNTAAEIASADETSFKTVVRTALPALLGGRWSGSGSVPERYLADLYDLRNSIVHAGRAPRFDQVNPAFRSYNDLVAFLDERIRSQWRSHRRTLTAWCEPWAGGTMDIPRPARSTVGAIQAEPTPYWLPTDLG